MRTLVLAGLTMVTALTAGTASAQRLGAGAPYPRPGMVPPQQPGGGVPVMLPPPPMVRTQPDPARPYPAPARPPAGGYPNGGYQDGGYHGGGYQGGGYQSGGYHAGGTRWGTSVGGRWYGGTQAPGGWNAYHRPSRGHRVPNYWISPSFFIGDYAGYGLSTPPQGYSWHRYYDDAVLIDDRGRVYDSRGGIDWDGGAYAAGGDGGYTESSSDGYAYAEDSNGYAGQGGYAPRPPRGTGPVTTYRTGGYAGGYGAGYAAPGTTTTVITIQPAETVTTTTTEYVEEARRRYVAPRHVYHAARPVCGCQRVVYRTIVRPVVRPVVRHRVVRRPVEQPILGS